MQARQRHHAAYTLIELLAGMTILGLMLFMINELFNNTSVAVTRNVQNGKVIATTRILTEQINEDFDNMLGPAAAGSPGGALVIVQQRFTNAEMTDPQTLSEVTVPLVRSDQILFIRNAQGLRSATPQGDAAFGSNLAFPASATDAYAKVWYGHGIRTNRDGTDKGTTLAAGTGLDKAANNFILGRHALLFNPTNLATGTTLAAAPGTNTYANNANAASAVQNSSFPGTDVAYMGLTDVTTQAYYDAAAPAGTVYDNLTNATAANTAYVNLNFGEVGGGRMRVNPNPDPATTGYAAWAAAQSHAILAQSCSEVIIDFAADLNGDGLIDTAFGGQSTLADAPIWWYDALDTVTNQTTLGSTTPWTAQTDDATTVNIDESLGPLDTVNSGGDRYTFVFRPQDATAYEDALGANPVGTPGIAHSYWPYLIRIRYRLHDTRGRLTSSNPAALTDGIDNDGDGAADNTDEDKAAGRWIEHIVRVPRP